MDMYLRIEQTGQTEQTEQTEPTGWPDGRPAGSEDRRFPVGDVAVRVEPSHTVGDVADAVAAALGIAVGAGRAVSLAGSGPLDPSRTVAEAGILSGETLILGAARPDPVPPGGAPTLVVASGPDVGKRLALVEGIHLVGRDPSCGLALTDPQVSRHHCSITVDAAGTCTMTVLAQDRNEVRTGGAAVTGQTPLVAEQVVRLGATSLVVRPSAANRPVPVDAFGQVPFHRTPYFPSPVQPVVVAPIDDIPTRPERSRFAYLSALLPLLMGISLAVLFNSPRYLLFAVFSPVMVIGNYFEQRRRSGRSFIESVDRFEAALDAKVDEVRAGLAAERRRRHLATPDLAALRERARFRTGDLWVRDRGAADFLRLRVGLGTVPTALEVQPPRGGDAEFRDQVTEAYGDTEAITDVPVEVDLVDLGVVGLVGAAADTTAVAASLVLQAGCLHSPEDLVVAAAVHPERGVADWLKWLPHSRSSSSPLAGPHLVGTKAAADQLVSDLANEVARRADITAGPQRDAARFPWLLVVLDRALEPDAALVSRLLDAGPGFGLAVLWLTEARERVPRQAQAVVVCRPARSGTPSVLSYTDPDRPDRELDLDRADPEFAATTGRALAPLRDASSANAATAIPRMVPLFTALGIESVDAEWVKRQWATDRGYALPAPIGATEAGPLAIDVVADGPHGLIGGTSGAGKSELMMSMVAGLIACNPPSRVNVLFIDYKGGASSDIFKDAPHTVGYVTNLDGVLAMRALTSLRAELNRRMNLLQGRAKDLAEMIDRHSDEAPPSLVIVVDEFATLVKEIPDFVTGIVDIAQRGRSLGIHLLLATQRPSGSVNDNIKANTNLRIALRMLDGAESSAVVGVPDAAAIPAPLKGRAVARLGPGDLVAFQSAWAGAPLLAESGTPPVGVAAFGPDAAGVVDPVGPVGATAGAAAPTGGGQSPASAGRTQIDALLDAITAAAAANGCVPARPPWLDVLPAVVPLGSVRDQARAGTLGQDGTLGDGPVPEDLPVGRRLVIGMVDDPAAQAQYPAVLDLGRSGGLLITGTGGAGKSTALVTAAVSAAMDDDHRGGGRLTVFGLDFASRSLTGLNRLPQCGGIATGDDLEAVTRLISLLDGEFERRRQLSADAAARAEPAPEQTSILLLIDGIDTLTQAMEQGPSAGALGPFLAKLTTILTDGRQVGIYPVVTASRRAAVRAGILAALSDRLTLRQADIQSYTDAGVGVAEAKDLQLAPGQGFLNGPMLAQVASAGDPAVPVGASADQRDRADRAWLASVADGLAGHVDPRLRTAALPRTVTVPATVDPHRPLIGVADLTGEPLALDLSHNDVSIVGDPRSGRSTALAAIGAAAAEAGTELWVVAPPSSPLGRLRETLEGDGHRWCLIDGSARSERLVAWTTDLEDEADPAVGPGGRPRLLLVDDVDLLPEHDRELNGALEPLLDRLRFAASGSIPRGFSSHPLVQRVRGCRSLILLRPHDVRHAHEVLGVPAPWHPGLPMPEGRGFVMVDRVPTMVQLADPFPAPADESSPVVPEPPARPVAPIITSAVLTSS
ncbi:MAG: FtsK/SpoIIIE domain-containing protein [Actinomycetota bacterium]